MASAFGYQTHKFRQGMWSLAVCHEEGKEGKLDRGGRGNVQHLFVQHSTGLLLGCCVARGLHHSTMPGEGHQMLQLKWAAV